MIAEGYGDARTLARRAEAMEKWIEDPVLLKADDDAEYHTIININMS
jgi:aconitate hydratase 2/2-methylisocitrate dehydratase